MKFIGRKLYLNWDPKLVLAIEKLPGASADELGLHDTIDPTTTRMAMRSLLVDVYDCFGERIEHKVRGTRYPCHGGREFQEYLTDTSNWVTVEESEKSELFSKQNSKKVVKVSGIGDQLMFYVAPDVDEQKLNDIKEWCLKTVGAEFYRNIVYLDTEDLAIQFQLTFV